MKKCEELRSEKWTLLPWSERFPKYNSTGLWQAKRPDIPRTGLFLATRPSAIIWEVPRSNGQQIQIPAKRDFIPVVILTAYPAAKIMALHPLGGWALGTSDGRNLFFSPHVSCAEMPESRMSGLQLGCLKQDKWLHKYTSIESMYRMCINIYIYLHMYEQKKPHINSEWCPTMWATQLQVGYNPPYLVCDNNHRPWWN